MSDHPDAGPVPAADRATIDRLTRAPEMWDAPPADLEDDVVRAIAAEIALRSDRLGAEPIELHMRRPSRQRPAAWWLGAAAAVVIVVAGLAIVNRGDDTPGTRVELAGTAAAPGASADVLLSSTPAGLKILLDANGLPGAPDGFFYEAWVSNGVTKVSAGTFHLRGGDAPIELWAGVADPGFTRLAVTLEPLDGDTDSSGDVRLVGEFELAPDDGWTPG